MEQRGVPDRTTDERERDQAGAVTDLASHQPDDSQDEPDDGQDKGKAERVQQRQRRSRRIASGLHNLRSIMPSMTFCLQDRRLLDQEMTSSNG